MSDNEPMGNVSAVRREGEWWWFDWSPTFDDEFRAVLTRFKETVPQHLRRWDPEKKRWAIHADAEEAACKVFRNLLGALTRIRDQRNLFGEVDQ